MKSEFQFNALVEGNFGNKSHKAPHGGLFYSLLKKPSFQSFVLGEDLRA